MKLLEPLLRRSESRYSLDDYAQWLSDGSFLFNGNQYPLGVNFTMPGSNTETIGENFAGYVGAGLKGNGLVFTCESVRLQVFAQARFKFRQLRGGRPGDLFGTDALRMLERPWVGGTTGELLGRALLDVDLAGNFYAARVDDEIVRLRPDWVDIVLEEREVPGRGPAGMRRFGYMFWPGGQRNGAPTVFSVDEVAHFAIYPDPVAEYRGMSWLTPLIREISADTAMTRHKQRYMDNSATPNLAVSLAKEISAEAFEKFVDTMDAKHKGVENAGKTLYLGGGADVTVVGADMRQLDFKVTQGAGETRVAAASGVGAVVAQFSEGLQGSSLNAGNYAAARRRFSDIPMRHAWQDVCGSLATLVDVPAGSELWYDGRDIPFLQEDAKDAAEIQGIKAATIANLVREGFTAESAVAAVQAEDMTLLVHTGKTSVQLKEPGSNGSEPAPAVA